MHTSAWFAFFGTTSIAPAPSGITVADWLAFFGSTSAARPNRKIVASVSTQTGRVDPSATTVEDA